MTARGVCMVVLIGLAALHLFRGAADYAICTFLLLIVILLHDISLDIRRKS